MPTLLDWNALTNKLGVYVGQYEDCSTQQSAFSHVVMEYSLGLDPEQIEDSITDGTDDRGIDAVYVDDRDGHNTIHLFQFKFAATFAKAKRNFPSSEIDKLLSFCADVLDESQHLKKSCNPLLWAKVQEIWQALKKPNPRFEVHFAGNMLPLVETQRKRAEQALLKYRTFTVRQHTLESVVGLFIEYKEEKIDASLQVVDKNYFDRSDGNIRGLIATVAAEEIVRLIADQEDPLQVRLGVFNDNVRVYLSRKNQINKKIIASAMSDKNAQFWYLNNGITMTCDSFSYQAGSRAPIVNMKNVQIVNGGQTSNALFEAYKEEPEKVKNALILTRIYETKTKAISTDIAESTNSQTPINTRDLRSNDEVQKKLEESFRDVGMFYERKAKQFADQPRVKRVDSLAAGQAFLAYQLGMPEVAKKDRSRVFSDLYDEVFNEDITPTRLLVPLMVLGEIERAKRTIQERIRRQERVDPRMLFLIDGAYHVLFTVCQLCEEASLDPDNEAAAKGCVASATNLVADLVKEEMEVDEAFTFNRFFKDAKTKVKIQALVKSGKYRRGKKSATAKV
jgi:hypothetical protein